MDVLREADELTREGLYEDALQKHLWLHEEALNHRPSFIGVRRSFALASWIWLGSKYPPARDALVAVRDHKAATVRSGEAPHDFFHDVAAINHYLNEESKTGALFVSLYGADEERARPFYNEAEAGLVALGRHDICSRCIADGIARFEELQLARHRRLQGLPDESDDDAARRRRVVEERFEKDVDRLIEILVKTNRAGEAERVRRSALKR